MNLLLEQTLWTYLLNSISKWVPKTSTIACREPNQHRQGAGHEGQWQTPSLGRALVPAHKDGDILFCGHCPPWPIMVLWAEKEGPKHIWGVHGQSFGCNPHQLIWPPLIVLFGPLSEGFLVPNGPRGCEVWSRLEERPPHLECRVEDPKRMGLFASHHPLSR